MKQKNNKTKAPEDPNFFAAKERFTIDTCLPQRQAISNGEIDFHAFSHGKYPGKRIDSETLPGVSSIGFWNAIGQPDWGLESHRNEGIELVFLETGNMMFSVDGDKYDLSAGDLTVTRPWQEHRLGNPNIGPGRLHWIVLDVNVRRPNEEWPWPRWVVLSSNNLKELTKKLRGNLSCKILFILLTQKKEFRILTLFLQEWLKTHM